MTQQAEITEQALLHYAERQTKALESLRTIAVTAVWIMSAVVFFALVALYVALVA